MQALPFGRHAATSKSAGGMGGCRPPQPQQISPSYSDETRCATFRRRVFTDTQPSGFGAEAYQEVNGAWRINADGSARGVVRGPDVGLTRIVRQASAVF
jgi:hypothetical protein